MLSLFISQCWYEGTNRTIRVKKKLVTEQYLLLTNSVKHFLYNMGSLENESGGGGVYYKEVVN